MKNTKEDHSKKKWDAIVVGSGIGGLAIAAHLARFDKKKVLIFEKHSKIGGFSHEFTRRSNYHFDVGVHYVGGLHHGSYLRELFDLFTDSSLSWEQLPRELDHLFFPNYEYSLSGSLQELKNKLVNDFSSEKSAIEKYFVDVEKYTRAYLLWQFLESFPRPVAGYIKWKQTLFSRWMFKTTEDYFFHHFSDPALIAILTAQWGGFGLPPSESSFGFHCVHVFHYSKGAWYPTGGGGEIGRKMSSIIVRSGGEICTSSEVDKILVDRGRACGVRVKDYGGGKTSYYSDIVISNSGLRNTYIDLLPEKYGKEFQNQDRENTYPGVLIGYLGLKDNPKSLGFSASNYWVFSQERHKFSNVASGEVNSLYLSFPSLKKKKGLPTAEIIVPIDALSFDKWKESHWKKRAPEYEMQKKRILEEALRQIDFRFPDFSKQVLFSEVATPLTVRHFQGNRDGAVFGAPATPRRLLNTYARSGTKVENLYMVGADTFCSGVSGAMLSSVKTYQMILASENRFHKWKVYQKMKHYFDLF